MLIFPLKKEWYEKIRSGEKTVEYREVKPYWTKRITNAGVKVVSCYKKNENEQYISMENPISCVFQLGYTKERLETWINRVEIVDGKDTDLHIDKLVYAIHFEGIKEIDRVSFNAGFTAGYEVGKKNERELQCGKKHMEGLRNRIHSLEAENEALMKSAIVWHKVICEDDPDNADRYLLENIPAEKDKEYLLKTKKYGFAVDKFDYDGTGFFFQDYDWDSIEAWAELPEVTV